MVEPLRRKSWQMAGEKMKKKEEEGEGGMGSGLGLWEEKKEK